MEKNEKFLKKYAEIIDCDKLPTPRFGHTVNLINKNTIVVFGGALNTNGTYIMTADLYLYNIEKNYWKKLEFSHNNPSPNARAAHAATTIKDNQLLLYGGSIGNGQYASEDLWFLELKNNNETPIWTKIPIEGGTPGVRYGHTIVYLSPILVLFGGSIQNEVISDLWILQADKTPFIWQKVAPKGTIPSSRLYHSSSIYIKQSGSESMILFGGRDLGNNLLKDLYLLRKDKNDYEWKTIGLNAENAPVERHQHCTAIFGPFFFVIGGKGNSKQQATFDVFSFTKEKWFRFGTIGLFRHSIWIYFNELISAPEIYMYIYGGFDNDFNGQINSSFYKINLIDLFNKNEILKTELQEYLKVLIPKKSPANKSIAPNENDRNHFELNSKVIVYNMPDDNSNGNQACLPKEISVTRLTEADKKISDKIESQSKKKDYDEDIIREFLQLLPNPDDNIGPLTIKDKPIILNKDYISKLINSSKRLFMKTDTIIRLRSPIKIFGNINGQYNDLMRYFSLFGRPSELKGDIESMDYLFLGNFGNRGAFSLEVICLILALKVKYCDCVHIIRGSHDDLEISKLYGLADECKVKLGENINDPNSIFKQICDLFNYFPLAAIINNQVLCVHSGIGEHTKTIQDISNIKRPIKVSESLAVQELLWSTPIGVYQKDDYNARNITSNYRQRTFDEYMLKEFFAMNKIKMIIRSHDVFQSGYEKFYNDQVVSIFSATDYCGIAKNAGAVLVIKKSYDVQPKFLLAVEAYSIWIKDNWNKTDCPPSPKKILKK